MVAQLPVPEVERLPYRTFIREFSRDWTVEAPHVTILAQTRAGKSHFTRYGILPLVEHDRVLIVDCKGDDPTWRGCGRPIRKLPRSMPFGGREPRDMWFRLIVAETRAEGREQVHSALDRVYSEGHWVVVLDEMRAVTDPQDPGLGLRSWVERLYLRGGSRGVMMVGGSQAPRWLPASVYDQAAHAFLGRVRDDAAQKRMREIGGFSRELDHVVANLRRREFLWVGEGGDRLVITEAPAR